MTLLSYSLILVYALCSASYALFIKTSTNRLVLFGTLNGFAAIIGLAFAGFVPIPDNPKTWLSLMGSMFSYNAMLYFRAKCYEITDMSILQPFVAALKFICLIFIGVFFFKDQLNIPHYIGIAGITIGLLIQVNPTNLLKSKGHIYAIFSALCSAAQLTFDVIGIQSSDNPFTYIVWLMFAGLPVTIWALLKHRREIRDLIHNERKNIFLATSCDIIGYTCFLSVLYLIQATDAIMLSYLSIVIGTLMGIFILKEQYSHRKVLTAFIVALAIILSKIL